MVDQLMRCACCESCETHTNATNAGTHSPTAARNLSCCFHLRDAFTVAPACSTSSSRPKSACMQSNTLVYLLSGMKRELRAIYDILATVACVVVLCQTSATFASIFQHFGVFNIHAPAPLPLSSDRQQHVLEGSYRAQVSRRQ
jgi:hypothetical protein